MNQRTRSGLKISLKSYCESWRIINVELHNIQDFKVVPEECVPYMGNYVTSSQYQVDSERTIEECRLYVSTTGTLMKDGKDARLFEIDDTVLSTLPYFKKHHFGGSDDELNEVQQRKANVREQLISDGYRVWGIVGDKYSSFEGLPRVRRSFKLPNPLYYVS
ncbi:unnamed protein product [Dovyalis caffra]|uniref:Uncharacterized protein n=1 Tax=Dovyalis caffra TaxID=77055 RepID=A0AAV1R4A6_9ROSI|nr:unnamed protein product [Dovyalis caffra]